MTEFGADEAKTHFAKLLNRVERGETIAITRRGRVVARLVPPPGRKRTHDAVVDEILELRKGRILGEDLDVRDLIDSDRR